MYSQLYGTDSELYSMIFSVVCRGDAAWNESWTPFVGVGQGLTPPPTSGYGQQAVIPRVRKNDTFCMYMFLQAEFPATTANLPGIWYILRNTYIMMRGI